MKTKKYDLRSIYGMDIFYNREWYSHPALLQWKGQKALVRQAKNKLKIYSSHGKFICEAPKFVLSYGNSGGGTSK